MKYFLILTILIILGLCGGGYYEYMGYEEQLATERQQVSELKDQANNLRAKNQKLQDQNGKLEDQQKDLDKKYQELQDESKNLQDDKTTLEKNANEAQARIAALTSQVQILQGDLTATKEALATATAVLTNAPAATPAAPPRKSTGPNANDLGTIVAHNGKNYENCHLLKVESDGITFSDSEGTDKVLFELLPTPLQERFGYDPAQGRGLSPTQVSYQESMRKAIESGNN